MPEENFDFISEGKDEIATSGNLKTKKQFKERVTKLESQMEEMKPVSKISPEVIAEARKLAQSKKGLEIDPFFRKHGITCNLNQLLHGKLDEDGYLI